ncbi:MAG TPA: SPOR domain-containing protein [Xanthomonadaceae bacterium]|nr:SPOR domain-containing protein [Xanthomonadaceae bacterium]
MSGRRGRSQARRKGGNGIPGWAWLVVGLVLGAVALWFGSSLLEGDGDFLRPRPNPDATPPAATADETIVADDPGTRFDFYTLLPGDGVAMSDEELAATAEAEAEVAAASTPDETDGTEAGIDVPHPDAADLADAPDPGATEAPAVADGARYVLQAGAFGERSDAEAVKARIALLGLGARVEPATIDSGRVVYRVRMGPYDSAAALAEAKRKLAEGGLPSLAIRAH